MGLWLKQDDGSLVPVGGGGGSAGGGEVLTGDPFDPPADWAVGQLLYDGVEDTGDGSAGGSIQYHSIGTSGVTGIEATEVDLPIVDVYGGPLVVGQKYAVSSEGSFRFGVGATSFVTQTVNINGSPAVECLAYKTFIDNERFMVSASRSWNCDDANPTVTVVASCSAGSMQTFNAGERRANVTFTPMQSSGGGGGDAGPHDHDYLPLAGGTVAGNLTVDGDITARVGGSADAPAYGFADMPGAGMFAHKSNNWLRFAVDGEVQMRIDPDRVTVWKGLRVEGTFNPVGGTAFGITEGIDTADVLDRAETATMPVIDDEGVATTDAEVDSITVNEVVTALLAKVKELSAEIEELKGA
jgi:hypothetical protein